MATAADHPTITLRKDLARAVRAGHPWLFADALAIPPGLPMGSVVDVTDPSGRFLARGLFDSRSPIAVRVWTLDPDEPVDAGFVDRKVCDAWALRRGTVDLESTDAFRLLHGEGDRVPGVVCDLYAGTAVIRLDTPAADGFVPAFVAAIRRHVEGAERVVQLHRPRGARVGEVRTLVGPPLDGPLTIHEHGLGFEVDVAHGHKTGFYLDQRDHRRRIGHLAAGRRVLNLFAYTGGFSVAAATGGATAVTTADISQPAIDAARRNFALNGVDPNGREFKFVVDDAFAFLDRCRERYDLVIVDPPSMAPSKAALPRALAAYRRLNALALGRVVTGGLLFTASCSSHVTMGDLRDCVRRAAAMARRSVRIVQEGGAGADHPVPVGFPEGRYLKTLLLEVS